MGRLASERGSDSPQMWTGSDAHLGTGQGPLLGLGPLLEMELGLLLGSLWELELEPRHLLRLELELLVGLQLEPELERELLRGPPVAAVHHYIPQ